MSKGARPSNARAAFAIRVSRSRRRHRDRRAMAPSSALLRNAIRAFDDAAEGEDKRWRELIETRDRGGQQTASYLPIFNMAKNELQRAVDEMRVSDAIVVFWGRCFLPGGHATRRSTTAAAVAYTRRSPLSLAASCHGAWCVSWRCEGDRR